MERKGQSWSVDVVLALVIFGFVAIAISSYTLMKRPDIDLLQQNSQRVVLEFGEGISPCDPILESEDIEKEDLYCVYENGDYETFKRDNKLKGDFCVFLEDSNGALFPLEGSGGKFSGWGSSDITVSGTKCGSLIS